MKKDLTRRYFFMVKSLAPAEDVPRAMQMAIGGGADACVPSLDDTVVFIKTTQDEINKLLSEWGEYTLEQILEATHTTECSKEEAGIRLRSEEFTIPEEII